MLRRTVLSFLFYSCISVGNDNIYKKENLALYFDEASHSKQNIFTESDEWSAVLKSAESELRSWLPGSGSISIRARKENCRFGENGCSFIAKSFPSGKIEVFSGILDVLDRKIASQKNYPVNKNIYRKNMIPPVLLHEFCHLKEGHHSAVKNFSGSPGERAGLFRNMETEADICAFDMMNAKGYDSSYFYVFLKTLKELYQERNKSVGDRKDFFDYTHLHPSPNERLFRITSKMNVKESEIFERLSELERIFSEIRRARSSEDIPVLMKNYNILNSYIKRNTHSAKAAVAELKTGRTLAAHKIWNLHHSAKELRFHGVIEMPLFSDAREFSELKGDEESPVKLREIKKMYEEILAFQNVQEYENYPEILSSFGLLLSYSNDKTDRAEAVSVCERAWEKKKNVTTGTNLTVVTVRTGFSLKSVSKYSDFADIYNDSNNKETFKTVYPLNEQHFFLNGEKKIFILNKILLSVESEGGDLKSAESLITENFSEDHPWIRYVRSRMNLKRKNLL